MITVKIQGGLGNQMFQYAFGRAESLRTKEKLSLDLSHYKREGSRSYALDKFNIETSPRTFLTKLFKRSLEGYWQSEKYFKEYANIIRKDFTLKDSLSEAAQKLSLLIGDNSVSVHIRRGDYLASKHQSIFTVCEPEYYKSGMQLIEKKISSPHYFVFSDDISFTKTLPFPANTVFIEKEYNLEPHEELILMSKCRHHIIANSSFSWWGAWLDSREDKIVVAPKKYYVDPNVDTSDWTPETWIRI